MQTVSGSSEMLVRAKPDIQMQGDTHQAYEQYEAAISWLGWKQEVDVMILKKSADRGKLIYSWINPRFEFDILFLLWEIQIYSDNLFFWFHDNPFAVVNVQNAWLSAVKRARQVPGHHRTAVTVFILTSFLGFAFRQWKRLPFS